MRGLRKMRRWWDGGEDAEDMRRICGWRERCGDIENAWIAEKMRRCRECVDGGMAEKMRKICGESMDGGKDAEI